MFAIVYCFPELSLLYITLCISGNNNKKARYQACYLSVPVWSDERERCSLGELLEFERKEEEEGMGLLRWLRKVGGDLTGDN